MFGVVLWSDTKAHKAVIWCEDHGDLAFYDNGIAEADLTWDAGDWVHFDLKTERNLRIAYNPQLVAQGICCDLAETLGNFAPKSDGAVGAVEHPKTAQIIPFRMQNKQGYSADQNGAAARTV
jgi:hypothetical protein